MRRLPKKRPLHRPLASAWMLAALVLLMGSASLRAAPPPADLSDNRAVLPGETNLDVPKLLQSARAAAREGRVLEAAQAYVEILDNHYPDAKTPGAAVVALGEGLYGGAADLVLRDLSALPPPARAACRERVEPRARLFLDEAIARRDELAFQVLIDRYPFSDSAGRAFDLLTCRILDAGRAADAAALADRFNRLAPEVIPATGAARLAAALAGARDRVRLAALANRIEREPALRDAPLDVAGKRTTLSAFAVERLSRVPVTPAAGRGTDTGWTQYGGDAAHARLMQPVTEPLRPLYRIPITAGWLDLYQDDPSPFRPEIPFPPPHFPAVADGYCYLATDRSVTAYAIDAAIETPGPPGGATTPDPAWRFEVPPPGPYRPDDRTLFAVTVHRGRVYAPLVTAVSKAEHQIFIDVKIPFPKRALMVLDAWTGRLLWRLGGALDGDGPLDAFSFPLPPTPDGEVLYAGATRQRFPTDPFDHFVVCLDAATGSLRWKTYISQGSHEVNLFNNPIRDSTGTAVAVHGDTLYYGTNLGCVAALDRFSGRLRWIRKYEQIHIDPPRNIHTHPLLLCWANNPPIVASGAVCFSPVDAFDAFGLDAATGELRWRLSWGGEHGEMWRYFLGVKGDLLFVGGRELMAIDLAAGGRRRWRFAPPQDFGGGKGGVTSSEVLFPTLNGLHRLDPDTGRPIAFRPWTQPGVETGHIISADGVVLASTLRSLSIYTMPAGSRPTEDELLARDPRDLLLRYRVGARALASGRGEDGERLLRDCLGRAEARRGEPDAERAAWLCRRQLVRRLSEEALREAREHPGRARDRLAEVRRLADDPAAAREQGLRLGRALRDARHWNDALAVLQDVIREAAPAPEAPPAAPGAAVEEDPVREQAVREVDTLLGAAGRGPYVPYESKAVEALAAARRDSSPARFAAVARAWPNSLAARAAGLEILALHEKAGAWEALATAARAFLREHPEAPESAEACRALATAIEQLGRLVEAKRILRQLADRWRGHPVRAGDRRIPAEAYAEERLKQPRFLRIAEGRAVPDLPVPLRLAWSLPSVAGRPRIPPGVAFPAIQQSQTRLLAFPGAEDLPPAGLLILSENRTVRALDFRTGQAVWERPLAGFPRSAAAVGETLLVFTDNALAGLRSRTGEVLWQFTSRIPFYQRGNGPAGALYVVAAGDTQTAGRTRLTAIDPASGRIAWTSSVPGFPISELFHYADHLALVTTPTGQVVTLDAATGKVEETTAIEPGSFSLGVSFLQPGRLALVSNEGGVQCLVPETGRKAWETTLEGLIPLRNVAPAGGTALALCAVGPTRQEAILLDPLTGKRIASCADLPAPNLADVVACATDGAVVYLLLRGRGRNDVVLKAIERTRVAWSYAPPPPGDESITVANAMVLTERHVVLPLPRFVLPRGPWLPRLTIVEKATGRPAQDLVPGREVQSLSPPRMEIFHGAAVILSDGAIQMYRGN